MSDGEKVAEVAQRAIAASLRVRGDARRPHGQGRLQAAAHDKGTWARPRGLKAGAGAWWWSSQGSSRAPSRASCPQFTGRIRCGCAPVPGGRPQLARARPARPLDRASARSDGSRAVGLDDHIESGQRGERVGTEVPKTVCRRVSQDLDAFGGSSPWRSLRSCARRGSEGGQRRRRLPRAAPNRHIRWSGSRTQWHQQRRSDRKTRRGSAVNNAGDRRHGRRRIWR